MILVSCLRGFLRLNKIKCFLKFSEIFYSRRWNGELSTSTNFPMSPPLTFNKVSNHPPSFVKPMLSIISKADKLCQQKKTVPVSSKGDNVKHAYEHHADDIEVPVNYGGPTDERLWSPTVANTRHRKWQWAQRRWGFHATNMGWAHRQLPRDAELQLFRESRQIINDWIRNCHPHVWVKKSKM